MAKIAKLTKQETLVHATLSLLLELVSPHKLQRTPNIKVYSIWIHTHTQKIPYQKNLKGKCNIQFSGSKNKVITGLFQTYSFPECKSSFEQKF